MTSGLFGDKPFPNQWWIFTIYSPQNKLQLHFNQNSTIFIHKNVLENDACEKMAIMFWPLCAKELTMLTCHELSLESFIFSLVKY